MSDRTDQWEGYTTSPSNPFVTLLLPDSSEALVLPHILPPPLGASLIFKHCTIFPFHVTAQMTLFFIEPLL